MKFYVLQGDEIQPFEESEIISLWKKGTLNGTDLVRAEELGEWTPLAKLLSLPSLDPTSPEKDESHSEKEKGPIADQPIHQNTVTSISDKSKRPDEQTQPVVTRSNPQSTRTPVLGKSTIFWGTLGAILAAAAILVVVHGFLSLRVSDDSDEMSKPTNAAVDVIDGYKSFKLGIPIEQVRSRIQSTANAFGGDEAVFWYERQSRDAGFFEVVNMLPEEKEWGGFEIKEITLLFRYGFLTAIRIELAHDEDERTLLEGFTKKYGEPTDTEYSPTWEGHETKVEFDKPPLPSVTFSRKSVAERAHALDRQEDDRRQRENKRRAEEVKKKLDAEP